jgi:hypothetical protein
MSSKAPAAGATAARLSSSSVQANGSPPAELIGNQIDTLLKQAEVLHSALQQLEDRIGPVLTPGGPVGIEARKPDERVSPFGQALFRIQDSMRALEQRLVVLKDRVAI